jgi:glycosyltransferase involved in cell wall biosynthesis
MHICFIEDTHLHGGTQIWVAEATRAFIQRGAQVTVLCPHDSWVALQSAKAGARIVSYDWDQVVHEDDENITIWTEGLRECDVAICTVHPPRHGFHCSIFAAKCIKQAGLRTHLIPKTGTIVPDYLREFYLPDESIESSVIAIADFTRRYLIDTYRIPTEKTALVYQGTDINRFRSNPKNKSEAIKRYPLPENAAPILGSIGSIEERKGHPILLEAVAGLAAGPLPRVHLMLVGDGPDEDKIRHMVSTLHLEDHVSFFPFTDEPNYIFERLDITVLPSLTKEGLPNVLLESMSMGVPVVSSNLGGVPEVVINGQTGYMVTPGDSAELASAIQKLWDDQDVYQKIRTNVRDLMQQQFDKQVQFDRFLEHFEALLAPQ